MSKTYSRREFLKMGAVGMAALGMAGITGCGGNSGKDTAPNVQLGEDIIALLEANKDKSYVDFYAVSAAIRKNHMLPEHLRKIAEMDIPLNVQIAILGNDGVDGETVVMFAHKAKGEYKAEHPLLPKKLDVLTTAVNGAIRRGILTKEQLLGLMGDDEVVVSVRDAAMRAFSNKRYVNGAGGQPTGDVLGSGGAFGLR